MDVNLLLHFKKKNLYQSFAVEQAYFWDGFQFKKEHFIFISLSEFEDIAFYGTHCMSDL